MADNEVKEVEVKNVPHWWESPEIQMTLTNSVSLAKIEEWSPNISISQVLNDSEFKGCILWCMEGKDIELKMKREVSRGDRYLMHVLQSIINSNSKDARILQIHTWKDTLEPANSFSLECEVKINPSVEKLKAIFPLPGEHNLLKILRLVIRGEIKIGTGESSDLYTSKIDFKFDLEQIANNHLLDSIELETPVPIQVIKNVCPDEKIILSLEVMLEWSNNEESIYSPVPPKKSFLLQLFESEKSKDFTIVVENGAEVKCHKLVLSSCSPVFEAMLSPTNGMKEVQDGKMTMAVSEQAVLHFIRFLYQQELPYLDLKCELALELLQMGHMYELDQLWKPIYNLLLQKQRNWFSTDVIIELYYFVRNLGHCETLENQLVQMMMGMTAEQIRSCELVQKLRPTEVADLMGMMYDKLRK